MANVPEFYVLTAADCSNILARNHVGRLAFRTRHSVDIQPVGYVASKDWLFMRSGHGAKLEALAHDPFVAFEVDEIDGPFDWRSVVAHGTVYLLPEDGAPIEQRQFQSALKALRSVAPEALTAKDPVPERQIVYGLHIDRVDGRMASSKRKPVRRAKVKAKAAPKRRASPSGF
jgi:nitroimidazol reductase NimA-like FMN-containing flavoprotein (pyridoxamine 5'-phosphate oxidase superfamily)